MPVIVADEPDTPPVEPVNPATAQEVRDRDVTGVTAKLEDGPLERHLDDAWLLLEPEVPSGASPARVRMVLARMVLRYLDNPGGRRSWSETTGPLTTSQTFGGDEPGGLRVTAEDIRLLSGAPSVPRRQRAFTIDTTPSR